jgi:hypothetical protein
VYTNRAHENPDALSSRLRGRDKVPWSFTCKHHLFNAFQADADFAAISAYPFPKAKNIFYSLIPLELCDPYHPRKTVFDHPSAITPVALPAGALFFLGDPFMASPAQILANRSNAQLSTGPKTEEGKRSSSRNSTRHGLAGSQIVIPGEDPAAYEELRKGMHDAHQPANDPERVLVDQIAASSWRLMRALRVETAFFAKLAEGYDNADLAIAAAMIERPKDIARIARYITAAENAYHKALRELTRLQKERAAAEEHAAVLEACAEANGFVSKSTQNSSDMPPAHMVATPEPPPVGSRSWL